MPWEWVPDPGPWASSLADAAGRWAPDAVAGFDGAGVRDAVGRAAARGEPWLRHPCMSRLTQPDPPTPYRDLAMAAWVAGHSPAELGEVVVADPVVLWSAAGDEEVAAGRYQLADLGRLMTRAGPAPVALDIWCRSTGIVSASSWAALGEAELAEREPQLASGIGVYLRTIGALAQLRPEIVAWISAATQVVRPLVPVPNYTRSSHDPGLPGLIEADLCRGPAHIVELIVHETAHLHLRAAEGEGPLVDPGHDGRYDSPLRPDPRPLIGILLAYHALAYICVALDEASGVGLVDRHATGRSVADLRRRRDDARSVIEGAAEHFTDVGSAFVARTHAVADHAVAPA